MDHEANIMTLTEVAGYLKVSEKTVLRMIQKQEIPAAKIANQWRFSRTMIDDWIHSKMQVIPQNDLAGLIEREADIIPLSRLIKEDNILMEIKRGSKEEILRQLTGFLKDEEKESFMFKKLVEREQLHSTALGLGVAIPHFRRPHENVVPGPLIVMGICLEGTDFDSLDKKKTHLFFLVITDSEVVHLKIMAKLGVLLRKEEIIRSLKKARTPGAVMKVLIQEESVLKKN